MKGCLLTSCPTSFSASDWAGRTLFPFADLIVLAVNKAQMQAFSSRDGAFAVRDAGLTEVPRGSLTVIALAPSPPMAELGKLYTL